MDKKQTRDHIERKAKDTVGYLEAASKDSFNVGVSVAISIAQEIYEKEIEELNQQLKGLTYVHDALHKDMKTLTAIIQKYSDTD